MAFVSETQLARITHDMGTFSINKADVEAPSKKLQQMSSSLETMGLHQLHRIKIGLMLELRQSFKVVFEIMKFQDGHVTSQDLIPTILELLQNLEIDFQRKVEIFEQSSSDETSGLTRSRPNHSAEPFVKKSNDTQYRATDFENEINTNSQIYEMANRLDLGKLQITFIYLKGFSDGDALYSNIIEYYAALKHHKESTPNIFSSNVASDMKVMKTFGTLEIFYEHIITQPRPLLQYLHLHLNHDNWETIKRVICNDRVVTFVGESPERTHLTQLTNLDAAYSSADINIDLTRKIVKAFLKNPLLVGKKVEISNQTFFVYRDGTVLMDPNSLTLPDNYEEVVNELQLAIEITLQNTDEIKGEILFEKLRTPDITLSGIISEEDQNTLVSKYIQIQEDSHRKVPEDLNFRELIDVLIRTSRNTRRRYDRLAHFLHSNLAPHTWEKIIESTTEMLKPLKPSAAFVPPPRHTRNLSGRIQYLLNLGRISWKNLLHWCHTRTSK